MAPRFVSGLLRFVEEVVPALFMAAMVIVIVADVFGRYVLNNPIEGAAELATALFLWVIFLGAAGAMRRHLHVNIDILLTRMNPRLQAACYLVINLLLGAGMLVLVPLAWDYAINNRRLIVLLQLPYQYIYLVISFGFLLVALHAFANAYGAVVGMRAGKFAVPGADQDFGVSEDTRPLFEPRPTEPGPVSEPEPA